MNIQSALGCAAAERNRVRTERANKDVTQVVILPSTKLDSKISVRVRYVDNLGKTVRTFWEGSTGSYADSRFLEDTAVKGMARAVASRHCRTFEEVHATNTDFLAAVAHNGIVAVSAVGFNISRKLNERSNLNYSRRSARTANYTRGIESVIVES